MLASQPEIVKTLFQAFTTSDEEEPEDTSLQQLGLEIMHKMAALQILDSLMDKMSSGQDMEHRENVQILECLEQAFALTFNPVGRRALADVFSKEDNFKYFLSLLKTNGKCSFEMSYLFVNCVVFTVCSKGIYFDENVLVFDDFM